MEENEIKIRFSSQDSVFPFFLPYLLPLIHIALTGSVYTTIAVAVERCITVLAPFTQIKVRLYNPCALYGAITVNILQ